MLHVAEPGMRNSEIWLRKLEWALTKRSATTFTWGAGNYLGPLDGED